MNISEIHLIIKCFLILMLFIPDMLFGDNENQQEPGSKEWTIIASYSIPGKASGLAWDGNTLYFGMYGAAGDQVYKFDPATSNFSLAFTNSMITDSYGMTFDGANLWITDHGLSSSQPAYALQLDVSGTIQSQFDLPDHYMSGIAWDEGDFWVCTYYPDPGTIYKVDGLGAILAQIPSPGAQPWDICKEGDHLWVADYYADMIYKVDQDGNVLEEHATENEKPAGIVYDGEFLWYVDGPLGNASTLYKVNLSGAGTPAIEVPLTSFNFGIVTIGDSASWNCSISNTGTADLEITNVVIQNAVPVFMYQPFPLTIAPGSTSSIEFRYKPGEPGPLNTNPVILSNDPVTPEVELTLAGTSVYSGPHILVPVTSHDFGNIRENATTRWFLEVQNNGDALLEITEITFDDEQFYLDGTISLPVTLDVLQTEFLGIWFNPDGPASFTGTATLFHNDLSQGNIAIFLSGSGDNSPYPIGASFWSFTINTGWDNSIKAIAPIGDVSDDGIGDVIVCSEDGFVRCFNGNASGIGDILWEHEAGSVNGQVGLTTINDIDGDNFQDVIVGLAGGVRAVKALSGKTGELVWIYDTHVFGDGGWVYQVWSGYDYNADGLEDVLASSGNDGNNTGPKRIFCLHGADGSIIWDTYTDGPNFSCRGVSDFTGDGLPDVTGGASNLDETEGKVYGIDGSDGSIKWTYTTNGSSVWALEQLDDVNGDGISDVIAGDFGGNYYLLDASDGSLITSGSAGNTIFIRFERLEDVNGNGYADIAFAYSGTNATIIDGLDGSTIWVNSLADKCWNIDRLPDITGDGINDLIAGTLYSNNYCYFLDGASGNEIHSINYGEAVDAIGAIPDINGDGSWELVAGGRNGKLFCYSSGSAGVMLSADFTADITTGDIPLTVQFTDLSSGNINSWEWDFENDGIIDAAIQNPQHIYTSAGFYSVALTVSDGANSNTLVKENYIQVNDPVFVKEMHEQTEFTAWPNPFQNGTVLVLELKVCEPLIIEIKNVLGETVATLTPINQSIDKQIYNWNGIDKNGQTSPPGLYIAKARKKDRIYTQNLLLH